MMPQGPIPQPFAYRATAQDGSEISGTIDASSADDARRRLQSLQLQNIQLLSAPIPQRARALRGEDFLVFNQQLAQLTGAGLPIEQGLRLVAKEMRRSSMRQTIDLVAAELESGKTLPEAVAAHRGKFPPLYSELIDAGIRTGNLSGILLNLGSHLTLIRRLQSILWQTLSYPIIVLLTFFGVLYFILVQLVPRWEPLLGSMAGMRFFSFAHGNYQSNTLEIPVFTRVLFAVSDVVSSWPAGLILLGILIVAVAAWIFSRLTGGDGALAERFWLPMPLVGIVLQRNLVSRWCHAVALAVEAGMDLSAAIKLADDAAASPVLRADGAALIAAVNSGHPLSSAPQGRILPATVVTAMETSADRGDLAVTLRALSQMYQQQAELRVGAVQAILTPILLLLVGLIVGGLMIAMFAPLLSILGSL
jgi:type IV pilus assembly protein PilC